MRARKAKTEMRREHLLEILRFYLRAVEQLRREGQWDRIVRAGVDPKAAAMLFLGLIQPAVILWTLSSGAFNLADQVETNWRLFVAAIT